MAGLLHRRPRRRCLGGADVSDTFVYVGDPTFNGGLNGAGFIGGGQVGYNIQRDRIVFGLEGDIGYLGLSESKVDNFRQDTCTGYYGTAPTTVNYSANMCGIDARYSGSSDLYGDITRPPWLCLGSHAPLREGRRLGEGLMADLKPEGEAIIAHDRIIPRSHDSAGLYQDLRMRGFRQLRLGKSITASATRCLKIRRFDQALFHLYHGFVHSLAMRGLDALLGQIAAFPEGKHDEQVDALSAVAAYSLRMPQEARRRRRWRRRENPRIRCFASGGKDSMHAKGSMGALSRPPTESAMSE